MHRDCDKEEINRIDILSLLEKKYIKRGQIDAWQKEVKWWEAILGAITYGDGGIGFNYVLNDVLDIGGAGAVFRVVDCNLYEDLDNDGSNIDIKQKRSFKALKVPRPHASKMSTLAKSLKSEVSKLTTLSHPNIVNIYAKGKITVTAEDAKLDWPWFIMEYLHNATDLQKVCEEDPPKVRTLLRYIHDVAKGIAYCHNNDVIHCDIKPSNIFLSQNNENFFLNRAILADFGYAKSMGGDGGLTTIGFTKYFAHPELEYGSTHSSQESRSFKHVDRLNLRPAFDLFALGISIHYLLEKFYTRYSVYRDFGYEIKYLRLCASRLLDGLNNQRQIAFPGIPYYAFRDLGERSRHNFVEGIRYKSIDEFELDMRKLLGEYSPEIEISELVDTRRENIQVSDAAPVVYTDRVRKIVEHPIVRRLSSVTQLGLVSLVYPGGSHSRLEHSLGTFGVTARYIKSLYNDTLSPIFKQLVTTDCIKITLLSALLHDIGQYPLAHDLEDVSTEFFGHEALSERILKGVDKKKHEMQESLFPDIDSDIGDLSSELNEIISDGWGISVEDILRVLNARTSEKSSARHFGSHVDRLCKSLIDGPIDADKLDYLERDSRHCNVSYGHGIDRERIFKCLTVACQSVNENHFLMILGVHEKGRISAESILFARYAMLTQVYWHHTMRAIKSLLHFAASEILLRNEGDELDSLKERFFRCAILGEIERNEGWEKTTGVATAIGNIHPGDMRIISWLWMHTSTLGKRALEHIINRTIYKRILNIYRSEMPDHRYKKLEKIFKTEAYKARIEFRARVEAGILERLKQSTPPPTLLSSHGYTEDEWHKRIENSSLRCLVDYPSPRKGAEFGLKVIRQWGERPPRAGTVYEDQEMPTVSSPRIIPLNHFDNSMQELAKSIACLRVFWHPDECRIIKEALKDDQIKSIVESEIDRFSL